MLCAYVYICIYMYFRFIFTCMLCVYMYIYAFFRFIFICVVCVHVHMSAHVYLYLWKSKEDMDVIDPWS